MTSIINLVTPGEHEALSYLSLSLLICILAVASYALYNIYFHPLSRYPGPKLFVAFRLPYVYEYVRGRIAYDLHDFHKRYGPVVRVAPDELSFIDPRAWRDIYGAFPNRTQNHKDPYTEPPFPPNWEPSLAGLPDKRHADVRKLMSSGFSHKAVDEQEFMIHQYVDLLVKRLEDFVSAGQDVQDMYAWWNWALFDLSGDLSFGESFHCLERAEWHPILKILFNGLVTGVCLGQLERYRVWSLLKLVLPKSVLKAQDSLLNYVANLVDIRLAKGFVEQGRPDFFNFLLKEHGEKQMSRGELYTNGFLLVVAGSETTASVLTGWTWYMIAQPKAMARAAQEVRGKFKKADDITLKSTTDLEYLNATVSETLRLFPAGPLALPRIIETQPGQMVAGHWVPYGTKTGIHHYPMYRSAQHWTKPEEFIPERWLPGHQKDFNDNHDSMQVFAFGPRNCLGIK